MEGLPVSFMIQTPIQLPPVDSVFWTTLAEIFVTIFILAEVLLGFFARRGDKRRARLLFWRDILLKWSITPFRLGRCRYDAQGIHYIPTSAPDEYNSLPIEKRKEFDLKFPEFHHAWIRISVYATQENRGKEKIYTEVDGRVKEIVEDPWLEEMKRNDIAFQDNLDNPRAER